MRRNFFIGFVPILILSVGIIFFCFSIKKTNASEIISSTSTTTTMRFYLDKGSGRVYGPMSTDWNVVRNAEVGDGSDKALFVLSTWNTNYEPRYRIQRSFLPFNTSILSESDKILNVSLNLFTRSKDDNDNDEYAYITVVKTKQASNTDLTIEDFDNFYIFGDDANEVIDINERKDITDIEVGKYLVFNLNSSGVEWISKIGWTQLGLREGHDYENISINNNNGHSPSDAVFYNYSSDDNTKPYLDITYTTEKPVLEIDPVVIVPGIMGSWYKDGGWKMDPVFRTYDNLVNAFVGSGYELDKDLFLFPYNWRRDNAYTSSLLSQKIEEIKASTSAEKVDIVAHSMGGIISRHYVENVDNQNDIDQLIFLNTPHQGSPESYLTHEGGEMTGLLGPVMKYAFEVEAGFYGYKNLSTYIKNKVLSVGQLLPTFNYLEERNNKDWDMRIYPENYPRNIFLEELNASSSLAKLKDNTRVTNVISKTDKDKTIEKLKVKKKQRKKWPYGFPVEIIKGEGDGTVPYSSLNSITGTSRIAYNGPSHREIVTKSQKEVIEVLTGEKPDEYYGGIFDSIKNYLFIRVYSPIDIQVTSPSGLVIGKNFESGVEINEIEGAFYSGFDEEMEFIVILNPDEGEYSKV